MDFKPAKLILKSGEIFSGVNFGSNEPKIGELIFNTAMTGYQEIITDLSYTDQLICFTYPQIGNTGVNKEDLESMTGGCSGIVIKELSKIESNWRKDNNLSSFLKEKNISGIANLDTRKLTRILRDKGSQISAIVPAEYSKKQIEALFDSFDGIKGKDLAREVSTKEAYIWKEPSYRKETKKNSYKVVAYDFGVKHNILRLLVDRGCEVLVVPAETSAEDVMKENPDGIFLSNGPGDPEPCQYAISAIKKLIEINIPIFGICLGHQLLGLALNLKTEKMKFGHHGANHPVQNILDKTVSITSQNHGFTISEESLNDDVIVTHRSLFDKSIQGISSKDGRVFSFQGHPEASPGPKDIQNLFDKFINNMQSQKSQTNAKKK